MIALRGYRADNLVLPRTYRKVNLVLLRLAQSRYHVLYSPTIYKYRSAPGQRYSRYSPPGVT